MSLREKIFKFLREQVANKSTLPKFDKTRQPSDYLGKGGGFERQKYGGRDAEEYAQILHTKKPSEITKVRLIFPYHNWEAAALKLIQKLGIVTGVFTSLNSAKKFVDKLVNKGVKADELVIGSHGNVGLLLITKVDRDKYEFNNKFLYSFVDLLHIGSKVFFTACYGADYLDSLKDAAEKLRVGVYGSAGVYNYITNQSWKGYYWCSPEKFEIPTSKKKVNGFNYNNNNPEINIVRKITKQTNSGEIKGSITIKNSVFGVTVPTITFENFTRYVEDFDIPNRGKFSLENHIINLQYEIYNYFIDDSGTKDDQNNPLRRKKRELNKQNKYMSSYIRDKFMSNEIVVEIELEGRKINIKYLSPVGVPERITNEFLLKKGLCKKVDSPPISWI